MADTKYWKAAEFPGRIFNTTGTWAFATASNVTTFNHTDADDTSILTIPIPKLGELGKQNAPKEIGVVYTVVTADLDAAPTAVLNKYALNTTTGVSTRSAVTQTLTFGGADTVGTAAGAGAAGTHIAKVTPSTVEALDPEEQYILELTFNAGATTVLKVTDIYVTYE